MSDKNKDESHPPSQANPPAPTPQDILNKKLLELRLKKEEELQRKRSRKSGKPENAEGRESRSRSIFMAPKKKESLISEVLMSSQHQPRTARASKPFIIDAAPMEPIKLYKTGEHDPDAKEHPKPKRPSNLKHKVASEPLPTRTKADSLPVNDKENIPSLPAKPTSEEPKTDNLIKPITPPITKSETFIEDEKKVKLSIDDKGRRGSIYKSPSEIIFSYRRPIAIERMDPNRHGDHKKEEEFEVTVPGKDEVQYITVIPADESKVVDVELEQWNKDRMAFLCLAGSALIMGVVIIILTLYASTNIYLIRKPKKEPTSRFLQHTDLMIICNTLISGAGTKTLVKNFACKRFLLGILVFRLFPDVPKHILARAHVLVYILVYLVFGFAFTMAFVLHEVVTGRREHVYSLHSMVGLIIIGFMVWELASGLYIIFNPDSWVTKYHGTVGMITFMLCGACCVTGYIGRALLLKGSEDEDTLLRTITTNLVASLILIFCCMIRYIATEFRFRRRSSPEWDAVFSRDVGPYEDSNMDIPGITLQKYVRLCHRQKMKRHRH